MGREGGAIHRLYNAADRLAYFCLAAYLSCAACLLLYNRLRYSNVADGAESSAESCWRRGELCLCGRGGAACTASFLSPLVFSYFVANPMSIAPAGMPWVSLYYLFALLFLAMLGVVAVVRFPKINITEERLSGSASKSSFMKLLSQRKVWLFFFAIFCYTSFEQSLSVYMSTFLERYHSIDPHTEGAAAVSRFWGAMFLGCLAGLLLLKLIDSKLLLKIACACAAILVGLGIFGAAKIALIALPAIGFTMAMMFPILFSLALNSVESHHGQFAGILCSAIVGGAIGPLLVSIVGDITKSLRIGMLLTYIYLGYILFMAFWARPIIKNKLVGRKGAVASE